ncbi:hypothetical protein GCM10022252_75860 [Streptosporangium oxazolinicum]|uniref:Uncharacterized protein n=1 Tax=Streptosporangium oxazolinicum TaxID=909287 RepID=A0ABP8BM41_9ACTN
MLDLLEVSEHTMVVGERLVVLRAEGWSRNWRAESNPYRSADGSWRIRALPEAAWYVLKETGLIPGEVRVEDVPVAYALVEMIRRPGGLF